MDELFGENPLPEPGEKYKATEAIFPTIEKELKRRGITRQILWERYITAHPDGYRLSVKLLIKFKGNNKAGQEKR